jgi:osmotically-inducible protein OsmY
MFKLLMLPIVGAVALGAYNLSVGNDLLHVPGARTIRSALGDTVRDTVRDGVRSAARETRDEAKERAAEAKERAAAGVHEAVTRTEDAVSTMTLTTKIKAKMTLDDLVDASDIDVDVDGGTVTLTGDVRSKDEQRRAVRIATETSGVTRVVNHIRVR